MAFPQNKVFIYQRDNRSDAPWSLSLDRDKIPAGTVVGVFDFKKKIRIIINVTDEDVVDEAPPEEPPVEEPPV
jgi:hypothetical protein